MIYKSKTLQSTSLYLNHATLETCKTLSPGSKQLSTFDDLYEIEVIELDTPLCIEIKVYLKKKNSKQRAPPPKWENGKRNQWLNLLFLKV